MTQANRASNTTTGIALGILALAALASWVDRMQLTDRLNQIEQRTNHTMTQSWKLADGTTFTTPPTLQQQNESIEDWAERHRQNVARWKRLFPPVDTTEGK